MDYATTAKLKNRAGDLDLPGTENGRGIPVVQNWKKMPICALMANRRSVSLTTSKEERDVWKEGIREFGESDMETFSALDDSDDMINIQGDWWGPQTANQEGGEVGKRVWFM